ncbi:MAG: glycosyltransferase family 4 protein [Lentisphaerae bacterium]|nr:glycosyltransferase family 4 protein [Lentisphaerota bacterium]
MRILVVTAYIDRSEAALYTELARRGAEVRVACRPEAPRAAGLREAGLTVLPLAVRHRFDLSAAAAVARLLDDRPPDVLYAPANRTLAVSLSAARRRPLPVVGYRGTIGHLSRWDPAARLTYLHPRVSRILCVSEAVRAYLLKFGLPPGRLVTVYKGHDPDWYAAPDPAARADFGIPPDAFLAGFTGTIRPVKGIPVLIRAFEALPDAIRPHLLLVGACRDRRAARAIRRSRRAAQIHTAGFRTDAAALAGLYDVFVMPSLGREGLPRAVIEAMAQRVPAVVSAVGGLPELVADPRCGCVVPPGDARALADALTALARDPVRRRRLGDAARARIAGAFHIDRTVAAVEALFRSLAR